jgi:TetR/AcrR family tetracycline transcriptional repressor
MSNGNVKSTPRRRLSEEAIARAALELVDQRGLDALNMRELASQLGVGTMTIYGYFANKRELLNAAVDVAAEDFQMPAARGGPRTRMLRYLSAVRAWLERHPAVVQLRVQEPIIRPSAFRISEHGMQILLDAGLAPAEAARGFRLLFNFVFGSVAFGTAEPSPKERASLAAALRALAPEDFPAIRAVAADSVEALGGAAQFDYEVARVLDGLGL